MKLYIKNMVCDRCKMVVSGELKRLKMGFKSVWLGEVELVSDPDKDVVREFADSLKSYGFELISSRNGRIISQIKKSIIEYVHYSEDRIKAIKFSVFLTEALGKDYNYLSGLFSNVEGITIEQYVINQKIEKVKELLVYDELTLGEIAHQLNYSSLQHLSSQFKKITGLTPSHFKKISTEKRKSIDAV